MDIDKKPNVTFDSNQQGQTQDNPAEYRVCKRRWVIISLYCLTLIINTFHLNLSSDIKPETYEPLEWSFLHEWRSILHTVVYLTLILPAVYVTECKGIRVTVLVGSVFTTLGAWIGCISFQVDIYPILVTGQLVNSVAYCFINSALIKLSAVWFGKNETATAISLGILSEKLGELLSFVSAQHLNKNINLLYLNHDTNVYYVYFMIAVLSSFVCMASTFVMKSRPCLPPSLAQVEASKLNQLGDFNRGERLKKFVCSILKTLRNRHFLAMIGSFAILTGSYNSLDCLMPKLLSLNFQGQEQNIKLARFLFICAGITGPLLSGVLLDRTKAYKVILTVIYSMTTLGMIVYWSTFQFNFFCSFLTLPILSFLMSSYYSVGYERSVELTFPVSETVSSGLLNIYSTIMGSIFVCTQTALAILYGTFIANMFLSGMCILGLGLTVLVGKSQQRQRSYDMTD